MNRWRKRFFDTTNLPFDDCEKAGKDFAEHQRNIMFWIGDLARYAEAKWPDTHHQVWPEWISPGLLARAAGVCRAYPNESDRQHDCTYTQYMQNASKPDRQAILAQIVEDGLTSDESRKADKKRWLLAVDVNYYLHRFWFSGAGVEAAQSVANWVQRTVERLKERGLTDCVCCFDSATNHRKELTADWEDGYKPRPPKEPELKHQIQLVAELLEKHNLACVSIEGFEADDVMASYANQFEGVVTLLTQDKDARQCLSSTCNILLDVEWVESDSTGVVVPEYQWLTCALHKAETGVSPAQWTDYQMIAGDNVDGIKGVVGIGTKGAVSLIQRFGTADAVIQAAKDGDESIPQKKREAILEFEGKADITRQLVTMRADLKVPGNTRIQ